MDVQEAIGAAGIAVAAAAAAASPSSPLFPPPPPPNTLPPAYPSLTVLVKSVFHPALLVLYSYFLLIVFVLVRLIRESIFHPDRLRRPASEGNGESWLWASLAGISLASTWTYMFKYFARSYSDWLGRLEYSHFGIPAVPTCPAVGFDSIYPCYISLVASHCQRWSAWLTDISLFQEAWLTVVGNDINWWWSIEVCLLTVGSWTIFLQTQRGRSGIPHLWLYMVCGQIVAISFAASLFFLALAQRPIANGSLVQIAAARTASGGAANDGKVVDVSEETIEGAQKIKQEMIEDDSFALDSEIETIEATIPASPSRTIITKRTTTTHHVIEPPSTSPSLASRLVLNLSIVVACLSISSRPQTFSRVILMHLIPLALTLPHKWLHQVEELIESKFLHPEAGSENEAATHASNARVRDLLRPSHLLFLVGVYSLFLKASTTYRAYTSSASASVRDFLSLLYPATFHAHPAQSSISSDAVCLALITVAYILVDSRNLQGSLPTFGATPLQRRLSQRLEKLLPFLNLPSSSSSSSSSSAANDSTIPLTLSWTLAVLTPLLGPAVTFSFYSSLREYHLEEDEMEDEKSLRALLLSGQGISDNQDKEGWDGDGDGDGEKKKGGLVVVERKEEIKVVKKRDAVAGVGNGSLGTTRRRGGRGSG